MDVPPDAALVCDFVNTCDLEGGTDSLDSEAALLSWLTKHRLASADGTVTIVDLDRAHALREALRGLLQSHHRHAEEPPVGSGADLLAAQSALDILARDLPLRVEFSASPRLVPASPDAAGLAGLLAAIVRSTADGSWARVKVCSADTCQWAFYDTSKNRSRTWCAMRICGNRAKTTNYRARQRTGSDL